MSFNASAKAWNIDLKGSPKYVLLCLADHADDVTFEAFPSIARIVDRTGLNRKTVMSCLSELEKIGVISTIKKFGSGNTYKLNLDWKPVPKTGLVRDTAKVKNQAISSSSTSTNIGTSTKNGPVPILGLDQYQNRDLTSTNIGTLINHESISNQSIKKNSRARVTSIALSLDNLPEQISSHVAQAFIDHRKTIKKPLSQHAFDLSMSEALKASSIGLTPDQAINETILAGWQGIKIDWLKNRLGVAQGPPQKRVANQSKHSGFENIDYYDGLQENDDGSHSF
jgi:hypothetical protein